jgi:uncharacterized protein
MATTTSSTRALGTPTVTTHPGSFGLFCLAAATIHLSLYQAGLIGLQWLGIALFPGALGMLCAGMAELKSRNAFGMVFFCALGLFWLSLLALIVLPGSGYGRIPAQPTLAAYLGLWGFFCIILASGAGSQSRSLQVVIGLLALFLFFMTAASTGEFPSISAFAGPLGIACGAVAVFTGALQRTRKGRGH